MITATKSHFVPLWGLLLLTLGFSQAALASPQIQHWQTSNGARVYFVPAPELPLLDLQLTFDAGAARDGDHPGLARLTNSLLTEGADELDANAIAEAFERVGARLSSDSQRDMATLSLRSLTEPAILETALEHFALLLHRPSFPEDALERQRRQMLTTLQSQRQRPGSIANRAFNEAVFGEHPYASPVNGNEEALATLTREQIKAFHRRYYVAQNLIVAMVGDLSRSEAETLAEGLANGLPAGQPAPALPKVAALAEASARHIRHDTSQTHILLGQPGVKRGDADYFPLYVGNHILGGGGLVSRISEEIREKRGLAYSASSNFLPMRERGPYTLRLQTRNDNTEQAITVLRQTLQDFVSEGPSEAELEAAKKNLIGGFALNTDSNSKLLAYIAMIGFYGLPLDYLEGFIGQVDAITSEQIREAYQRRIDPQRMALITVGGGGE